MADFSGWELPVHYEAGILQEHLATRKFGGLFDISHMARFLIKGSGTVPFLHPGDNKVIICDLCGGEPKCVEVCTEAGYNALTIVNEGPSVNRKLYSRNPIDTARDLAVKMFGEKGEEVIE